MIALRRDASGSFLLLGASCAPLAPLYSAQPLYYDRTVCASCTACTYLVPCPAGTYRLSAGRALHPGRHLRSSSATVAPTGTLTLNLTLHLPSNLPLHLAGHLRAVRPRRLGLDFSARVDQDDQGTPRVAPAQANIYGCVTRPRSLIIAASAGNAFPLTHACGGHRFESPPAFISTESPMELFHSADKVREA